MIRGLGGLLASRLGLLAGTGLGFGRGQICNNEQLQLGVRLHKILTMSVLITEGSYNYDDVRISVKIGDITVVIKRKCV